MSKQYYVWNIVNIPNTARYFKAENPQKGKELIDIKAQQQLLDRKVTSNAFGLIVAEGDNLPHPRDDDEGEYWQEWYNKDGEDIDEAAESGNWEEE